MPERRPEAVGARSLEHGFDRLTARRAEKPTELAGECFTNRVATKEKPRNAYDNKK